MNNEFVKPYIAQIYGVEPQKRYFVYPREILVREQIFPYYVLDGGAFFFACDHFGDATSDTLLEKTMSGEMFELLRDKDGRIDWGRAYHTAAETGMSKQHEWQSWPQRLYMLLPIGQAFLRTGDRKYSDEWLRILRDWIADSPYESPDMQTSHVNTSMKWRDMQVSWRAMTLIHSVYLLGSHPDAFTRDEWKEIYEFIDLNLFHLASEGDFDRTVRRLGNHTLQMASALISGGILFAELPRAREYFERGIDIMTACFHANVMPDGGTREVGPSYNHFIARLYLEAQKHCELNGYPEIDGLHDSVIRQYQWLATVANKAGRSLRLSDAYGMDAHADVRLMGEIYPFEADFSKKSVWLKDSGYIMLRNTRSEMAIDAMRFFGGHQHYGRIQPLLWADGEEVLTDTGCCNYDRGDLYVWGMTAEAHSVITCDAFPLYTSKYDVEVLSFDGDANTVTACMTVSYEDRSYTWTRTIALYEDGADFTDSIEADEEYAFKGRWYLPERATAMEEYSGAASPLLSGAGYFPMGHVARQRLGSGSVTVRCDELMEQDRTPAMTDENKLTYLERLTWTRSGKKFAVKTEIRY